MPCQHNYFPTHKFLQITKRPKGQNHFACRLRFCTATVYVLHENIAKAIDHIGAAIEKQQQVRNRSSTSELAILERGERENEFLERETFVSYPIGG